MPAYVTKFAFNLKDLDMTVVGEDGLLDIEDASFFKIPDTVERGIRKRWTPINVESDPETGTVWVWAYLID
jgi:hypothetical protein